jgi:hypothetical protein
MRVLAIIFSEIGCFSSITVRNFFVNAAVRPELVEGFNRHC